MSGKTHLTTGILCASMLAQNNPVTFIKYISFAALGSLILDVDANYSLIQCCKSILFYGIVSFFIIYNNQNWITIISIISIIIISILIKKYTTHRSLTHSCLGMLLYGIPIFFISKIGLLYFIIGYLSHLILDVITPKGIMFLYPYKKMLKYNKLVINKTTDYTIRCISVLFTLVILFL